MGPAGFPSEKSASAHAHAGHGPVVINTECCVFSKSRARLAMTLCFITVTDFQKTTYNITPGSQGTHWNPLRLSLWQLNEIVDIFLPLQLLFVILNDFSKQTNLQLTSSRCDVGFN
jgi:hypothetical protein